MSKMTRKGQVTIPKRVRQEFGLRPGSEIEFGVSREGELVVKSKSAVPKEPAENRFAAIRGTLNLGMTTDEFMRFIRGDPDDDFR